jgi:hypothetical protein
MNLHERLHELLTYNSDTGVFTWTEKAPPKVRKQIAGSKDSYGHVQIQIDKKIYAAHRLAWLYVHGKLPDYVIDHINGVRDDNRIKNLRDVTILENAQNIRKPLSNNKSGYLGVSFHKATNKYAANIRVNNVQYYLGVFDTPEKAYDAYIKAKREFHTTCTI